MILTAITIAINVVPIAGVLLMNQHDLLGLVVSPEINTVMGKVTATQEQIEAVLTTATLVDSHYDAESRKTILTYEITNPTPFDLAVNGLSANFQCLTHHFQLGQTIIDKPVSIRAGETGTIALSGFWTQEAIEHLWTKHEGEQKIDVELNKISVDVNGINIQTDVTLKIPDFPVT